MSLRVILLMLVASTLANNLISLSEVGDVFLLAQEVVIDVNQTWKIFNASTEDVGSKYTDIPIINLNEGLILFRVSEITNRVDQVNKLVQTATSASMLNLKKDIPSQIRLELGIDTLLDFVSTMKFAAQDFKEYVVASYQDYNRTEPNIDPHTLQSFASYVVSHNHNSVQGILDRLHIMIHPDPNQGHTFLQTDILEQIRLVLQEGENSLCHVQQSPHQIIYNLYNSLQMTQLKGYTMMQFSWMLLRLYKKGNFEVESHLLTERYLERMYEQAISLKEALKKADSAYWKCDPKHHVEGETYLQLTKLLQGYIQNEVDLSPKQSCSKNCGYYDRAKQHSCYANEFCARQRSCNGEIVECQFIDSDMWVCQANTTVPNRRYEWIEYENGRTLGNKGSCQKVSKVDSWWRWLFWHCSYCFCLCDDATNFDRYFSLRSVLTDTDNNRVITGIRFVKMNGVVYMQIQKGTLEPYGNINGTSTAWQPVDNFKTEEAVEGEDYMKLSYDKRAIDLDDLLAPPEHVITGVQFRMVGSHLNLDIRATPFNFLTGQLIEPGKKDVWLSNDNTDKSPATPRTKVDLDFPDNPLNSLSPSKIDSKSNQYLLFTHSDIDLDAAQTTIPFLDAQMVVPQPPVPLAGIGVYHKGARGFGGFVGLKVFTYDFGNHIEDSLTDLNITGVVD